MKHTAMRSVSEIDAELARSSQECPAGERTIEIVAAWRARMNALLDERLKASALTVERRAA